MEALLAEEPKPSKRGPAPKIQQQLERISQLPKTQQRLVMQMLEGVLAQTNPDNGEPQWQPVLRICWRSSRRCHPDGWPRSRISVDFLAHRESRSTALDRLLAIAPALEAAGEPQMTEEEIAAEIKAVRAERRARQTRNDDNASGRT